MKTVVMMAALVAASAAAGTAVAAERLRGFEALAGAERIDMTGVGFGRTGRFTLGTAQGRFERTSSRERRWGVTEARATLRFTLSAPDAAGQLAGECRADEAMWRERPSRRVTITTQAALPQVMCRFTRDGVPAGMLELDEVPTRGLTVKEERRGTVRWQGGVLGVRSVHHFAPSPLPAGAPLGYLLEDGRGAVAGVDVTRPRRVVLLPRGPAREAALAATAALALLWEPDAG